MITLKTVPKIYVITLSKTKKPNNVRIWNNVMSDKIGIIRRVHWRIETKWWVTTDMIDCLNTVLLDCVCIDCNIDNDRYIINYIQ